MIREEPTAGILLLSLQTFQTKYSGCCHHVPHKSMEATSLIAPLSHGGGVSGVRPCCSRPVRGLTLAQVPLYYQAAKTNNCATLGENLNWPLVRMSISLHCWRTRWCKKAPGGIKPANPRLAHP